MDKSPAELPLCWRTSSASNRCSTTWWATPSKYTPQGKVVLSALVEGNFLRIKVTDTGIGIARDHLEHIFEPLVQMSPEVSKQGSRPRSLHHPPAGAPDGELFVESRPSVGSTFAFTLPLASGKAGSLTLDSRQMSTSWCASNPSSCRTGRARICRPAAKMPPSSWWWMTSPSICTYCATCCSPAVIASCPAATVTTP